MICGEQNQATVSHLPAVLPHQWVTLSTSDVVDMLRQKKEHLLVKTYKTHLWRRAPSGENM
jgi:hypothetical protein